MNFSNWMASEAEYFRALKKKSRKKLIRNCLLTMLGVSAALAAIALIAGSGMDGVVQNIKYSLFTYPVILLIFALVSLVNVEKAFNKYVTKSADRELPSGTDREAFGAQMLALDGHPTPFSVSYKDDLALRCHIFLTKDYIYRRFDTGGVAFIRLNDVEKAELDVDQQTYTSFTNHTRVTVSTINFPIYFFYRNGAKDKKGNPIPDQCLNFPERELRSHFLEKLKENTQEA